MLAILYRNGAISEIDVTLHAPYYAVHDKPEKEVFVKTALSLDRSKNPGKISGNLRNFPVTALQVLVLGDWKFPEINKALFPEINKPGERRMAKKANDSLFAIRFNIQHFLAFRAYFGS